jgi:O-antigen biosynthesis protein WbqP
MYEKVIKRLIDLVLSGIGAVILAIPMAVIAVLIKIDDPGPVLFKQKRIKKGKKTFSLFKYRSMKMSTPHDMPTHLLTNPEQYITKTGGFLRKYSLDELPQIYNILLGHMSIIGPRPALWNQDDLIAERDKYGANDVKPGLTGWAQINGRDSIEIEDKAKLDGDYTKKLKKGGLTAFAFDMKCFLGTITSVLKHDGVVEGGTGELNKNKDKVSAK